METTNYLDLSNLLDLDQLSLAALPSVNRAEVCDNYKDCSKADNRNTCNNHDIC